MKILTALFLIYNSLSLAGTAIPRELSDLAGGTGRQITLNGKSSEGLKCQLQVSDDSYGYSAYVSAVDANNKMILKNFAKLQIGLGHELKSFTKSAKGFKAITEHKAEEQYSSDDRNTMIVELKPDQTPASVEIINETKGLFFGYNENSRCKCLF